jgi:hypothetical protein
MVTKIMTLEDAEDRDNDLEAKLNNLVNYDWPTPKWVSTRKKIIHQRTHYKDYLATQLRARYSEIEADFRTLLPDYVHRDLKEETQCMQPISCVLPTAEHLIRLLESARAILEKGLDDEGEAGYLGKQELLLADNLLDLAEECMVWIYTPDLAETEIPTLIERIQETKNLQGKESYISQLLGLGKRLKEKKECDFRPIFDQIIWICNKMNQEETINTGLQIERLRHFARWGTILIVLLLIIFPSIFNFGVFKQWSNEGNTTIYGTSTIIENAPAATKVVITWIFAFGIAITGAIGAYLSGFLQARSSRTNLALYEESQSLSMIRLEFGALAALITSALLSWDLLSGLLNNSPGPYILAAFLSGFSERYFLDLLKIKPDGEQPDEKRPSSQIEPKTKPLAIDSKARPNPAEGGSDNHS